MNSSSRINFGNAVVIGTTTTRPSLKPLCCDLGDDALHGGSDLQQVQCTLLDWRRRGHHLHGLVSYANLIHRQRRQVFEQSRAEFESYARAARHLVRFKARKTVSKAVLQS